MFKSRPQPATPSRTLPHLAGLAGLLLLALAGCIRTYVFPAVEVESTAISPTYRLEIENGTSEALRIDPVEVHEGEIPARVLEPGETFGGVLVAIRTLMIGGNPVPQIVDGAYLSVMSAGLGEVRLFATREAECPFCQPCPLILDVRHPSWFEEREEESEDSPLLRVRVNGCEGPRTLFRNGPGTNES